MTTRQDTLSPEKSRLRGAPALLWLLVILLGATCSAAERLEAP
jgi:hypothetical protein